jgi:hypothetical protein
METFDPERKLGTPVVPTTLACGSAIDTGEAPSGPTLPNSLGRDDDFGLDVLVENARRIEVEQRPG